MRAGVRRAGVQAWRVAVDHTVVVSSRRYPHWATAHHETTRWFAERYNTVTTQSTVPNKSGVWRGRCCCCIVEVVLWSSGGGGDDYDATVYKRAPEPHRCSNTHKLTCTAYTRARRHAGRQARTHTSTHAYGPFMLQHCGHPLELHGPWAYTPPLPTTTHATTMTGAGSPSFGAVGVHLPWLRTGPTLLLPGGSTHFDKLLFLHVVLFREEADQSDLILCLVISGTHRPSRGTTWPRGF